MQSLPFTGGKPEVWRGGHSGSSTCLDQGVGTSSGVVSVCVYSLVIFVEIAFAV